MREVWSIIECEKCGGNLINDYGKCMCETKEIKKLKNQLRDCKRIFHAYIDGDIKDLPKRLQKKFEQLFYCRSIDH